jgi:tripartite-type tricarboxylate transporter receptor subunit TctC
VAEFIELLKSRPGKLTYASSGLGSSIHLAGELFKLMTHTDMLHVPYRGSAPAITDLLAGNVDVMFDNLSNVWPQVQQGALRPLGVASLQRTPLAPDVPAIAETVPGYEATSWVGIVGPAGIPQPILEKISMSFGEGTRDPAVFKRLAELGATPAANTPAAFRKFIADDRAQMAAPCEGGQSSSGVKYNLGLVAQETKIRYKSASGITVFAPRPIPLRRVFVWRNHNCNRGEAGSQRPL